MIDSVIVLWGQTIAYTLYVLAIFALMGWFAYNITKVGAQQEIKPALFYSFFTFLVVLGVSLHIVTHETIPWKSMDLNRENISANKSFDISVANHQFKLPQETLEIKVNDIVRFNVTSKDLTYGFGVFRQDHSMMFQMQVVPGHNNDILWLFDTPGVYTIRSTEYSGPAGVAMTLPDVIHVTE
jgi:cytochrome c oxidase subunit 2